MTEVVIADAVVAVVAEMLVVKARATGCWAGIYTAGPTLILVNETTSSLK